MSSPSESTSSISTGGKKRKLSITAPSNDRKKKVKSTEKKKSSELPACEVIIRMDGYFALRRFMRKDPKIASVASMSHMDVIKYAVDFVLAHKKCKWDPDVETFFSSHFQSKRFDLLTEQVIWSTVQQQTNARLYRLVSAVDDSEENNDQRLSNLLRWALDNVKFSHYELLVPFFTFISANKRSSPKKDPGIFYTDIPSTFERFLALQLGLEFYYHKNNVPAKTATSSTNITHNRTDMRLTDISAKTLGLFQPRNISTSRKEKTWQKFGYFTHQITHAWLPFCRYIGFESVEQMLNPILTFNASKAQVDIIRTRADGYRTVDSSRFFDATVQSTTKLKTETFENAANLSDFSDDFVRKLAVCYLNDIKKLIYNQELHDPNMDRIDLERCLSKFWSHGDQRLFGVRFDDFDGRAIETVKTERMLLTGATMEQTSLPVGQNQMRPERGENDVLEINNFSVDDMAATVNDDEELSVPMYQRKKKISVECASKNNSSEDFEKSKTLLTSLMEKNFKAFNVDFDRLQENIEDCDDMPQIYGKTQLVLVDPPYNIRFEVGRKNSGYDRLFPQEMDRVIAQIDNLLRPGGHAVIFCSFQQFPSWEHKIQSYAPLNSEESCATNKGRGPTFNVDKVPIVFVNKFNVHNGCPVYKSTALQSNTEIAVHLKKNGLSFKEECAMVNYRTFNYVHSSFMGSKNTVDNCPKLAPNEGIYVPLNSAAGSSEKKRKKQLLRPEQKPLPILKELISRFSQPGDVVVDFCAGTFSTGIACFSLPNPRFFVGCEKDTECFDYAMTHVLNKFAKVISNPNHATTIDATDDEIRASCIVARGAKRLTTTNQFRWKSPEGFPQFQTFPNHILAALSSATQNMDFYKVYRSETLDRWPIVVQQVFNAFDADRLRDVEQAVYGLITQKSSIRHPTVGLGVFAAKSFSRGQSIAPFYGTLAYRDLQVGKSSEGDLYGGSVILDATVSRFENYSVQLKVSGAHFNEIPISREGTTCVYVIPAPFCVASYINEWKYYDGDKDKEFFDGDKKKLQKLRKPNVSITQYSRPITNITQLHSFNTLTIQAIDDIECGEELYCDYGDGKN